MIRRLKKWIVSIVVQELQVGGHCGLCGKWIEHVLVSQYWPWTVCKDCVECDIAEEVDK